MKRSAKGFTLIELLVVVSVVAIMMTIAFAGLNTSQQQSRDVKRQAEVRLVQNALELYKNKYGRYPEACDSRVSTNAPNWAGETGTGSYECGTGNQYIVGLAPEFIPELPRDPRAGADGDSGYVYAVNADGSVYKFMAWRTVEAQTLTNNPPDGEQHEFFRCGSNYDTSTWLAEDDTDFNTLSYTHLEACQMTPRNQTQTITPSNAFGSGGYTSSDSEFPECTNANDYETTYAVSGGFARNVTPNTDEAVEFFTERIRCR